MAHNPNHNPPQAQNPRSQRDFHEESAETNKKAKSNDAPIHHAREQEREKKKNPIWQSIRSTYKHFSDQFTNAIRLGSRRFEEMKPEDLIDPMALTVQGISTGASIGFDTAKTAGKAAGKAAHLTGKGAMHLGDHIAPKTTDKVREIGEASRKEVAALKKGVGKFKDEELKPFAKTAMAGAVAGYAAYEGSKLATGYFNSQPQVQPPAQEKRSEAPQRSPQMTAAGKPVLPIFAAGAAEAGTATPGSYIAPSGARLSAPEFASTIAGASKPSVNDKYFGAGDYDRQKALAAAARTVAESKETQRQTGRNDGYNS